MRVCGLTGPTGESSDRLLPSTVAMVVSLSPLSHYLLLSLAQLFGEFFASLFTTTFHPRPLAMLYTTNNKQSSLTLLTGAADYGPLARCFGLASL